MPALRSIIITVAIIKWKKGEIPTLHEPFPPIQAVSPTRAAVYGPKPSRLAPLFNI